MSIRSDERLGSEKMLPLIFKMALPAVAAQLVNLLYGVIDRIYIGHIKGVGGEALAGVGITTSVIILISHLLIFLDVRVVWRRSDAMPAPTPPSSA